MDKYTKALDNFLLACSEEDRIEATIWMEELGNLLIDKVPMSNEFSELCEAIREEFSTEFRKSHYLENKEE